MATSTSSSMDTAPVDLAALARAHIEAQNSHNVDRVMRTVAEDVSYRGFPGGRQINGGTELREFWTHLFKRIPELHVDIKHLMKDEQQREVFIRCLFTGTDKESPCLEPGDDYIEQNLGILYRFNGSNSITEAMTYPESSGLDLYGLAQAHVATENRTDLDAEKRADLAISTVSQDASYLIYPTAQELRGRETIRQYYADSFRALPDMNIDIQHMMKDEEKRQVVCQYRITGRDSGHLQGLEPTNRDIEYYGNILYQFDESGKVTKEITYFEKTEVLATMGLIRNTTTPLGLLLLFMPQSPLYALRCIFANLFGKKKAGV